VLRAELTEVLVTGMLIRWISVRPRPMAVGAKPAGALIGGAGDHPQPADEFDQQPIGPAQGTSTWAGTNYI
jgi:hypothetical protein